MAEMNLAGRTALVTGASRGIGYFTALQLAQAGASPALSGHWAQRKQHWQQIEQAVFRILNDYEEAQGQQSTVALKVQIKLNHLINSHKAPLKLYDDIIDLFNEYMSSDNFNEFARLKSRKSFIKANKSTYKVIHLRPKHQNVVLTDGAEVTNE